MLDRILEELARRGFDNQKVFKLETAPLDKFFVVAEGSHGFVFSWLGPTAFSLLRSSRLGVSRYEAKATWNGLRAFGRISQVQSSEVPAAGFVNKAVKFDKPVNGLENYEELDVDFHAGVFNGEVPESMTDRQSRVSDGRIPADWFN